MGRCNRQRYVKHPAVVWSARPDTRGLTSATRLCRPPTRDVRETNPRARNAACVRQHNVRSIACCSPMATVRLLSRARVCVCVCVCCVSWPQMVGGGRLPGAAGKCRPGCVLAYLVLWVGPAHESGGHVRVPPPGAWPSAHVYARAWALRCNLFCWCATGLCGALQLHRRVGSA